MWDHLLLSSTKEVFKEDKLSARSSGPQLRNSSVNLCLALLGTLLVAVLRYCSLWRTMVSARYLSPKKVWKLNNLVEWKTLVLISTGEKLVNVSSYLVPKSSHKVHSWEETDTNVIFKLEPTFSTRKKGCQFSGSKDEAGSLFKPQLMLPEG